MHTPEPHAEHRWLHQLIGEWNIESEFRMEPDQPPMKTRGREVVRALGELWTIGEGSGNTPDDGSCDSMMTLGYDPAKKRFVGSFIASAMTHFWSYDGSLDESGRVLTLDAEGPSFAGDGTMARYQDIIEFVTDDHRTLTSRMQSSDGSWSQFMIAHYRRE
jgi:hypothetical protein